MSNKECVGIETIKAILNDKYSINKGLSEIFGENISVSSRSKNYLKRITKLSSHWVVGYSFRVADFTTWEMFPLCFDILYEVYDYKGNFTLIKSLSKFFNCGYALIDPHNGARHYYMDRVNIINKKIMPLFENYDITSIAYCRFREIVKIELIEGWKDKELSYKARRLFTGHIKRYDEVLNYSSTARPKKKYVKKYVKKHIDHKR